MHYMRTETVQVRLTADEKRRLLRLAGSQPVASYIREKLYLGAAGDPGTPARESDLSRDQRDKRIAHLMARGLPKEYASKVADTENWEKGKIY